MAIYGLGTKSRQIYEFLHARIGGGQLSPGARLPSQRVLAETFSVSQMTARRALAELESDGLVVRQPGSGWYVSDHQEPRDTGVTHTARLQALTAALSMAVTPRDVSMVLGNEGASAVGAIGTRVTILSEDGTTLRTLGLLGPQLENSDLFYTASLSDDTPLANVVRTGHAVWELPVEEWESRYPAVADAFRQAGYRTAVILPVSVRNKTLGALSFGFGDDRVLSAEDRAFILALTNHCAEALERAGLYESLQHSEERFRALVEELPVAAYTGLPGSDSPMSYASPEIESMLGYSRTRWTTDRNLYYSILHPEDRDSVVEAYERSVETGTRFRSEHRMIAADGRVVWIRDEAVIIRRPDAEPASEHGVLVDITERKQAENVLLHGERRYRGLFESSPDGIGLLDGSGCMLMANGQLAHMLGYDSPDAMVGTNFMENLPEDERSRATDTWTRRVQGADLGVQATHYRVVRRDGTSFPAEVRTSVVPGIDADSITATVTIHDVTERNEYEAQLQHLALHDTTTGLPNRTLLEDRLQQNLSVAQRARKSLAVLVLDFDQFKEINDTFGHSAGDEALQEVGRRLSDALRESDTIARLGGDEFGIILPDTDLLGAVQAATKLTHVLEQPIDLAGGRFHLGVSLGIALFPDHATEGERLLQFADVAMHAAKAASSGYAVYAVDRDPYSPTRLALSGELREAIETDALVLHYQPKMQLIGGEIDGLEALVRWNHPVHGLIPPDQFIPLAEHSGLIRPLTAWVVEHALAQCGKWRTTGLDLGIAINLSARSLHGPELARFIIECLRTSGVPPARLTVEITESVIMANPERAMEVLTGLTEIGVKLSIDDFGTGYSSLAYLRNLRAHEVKIDKSFVVDLDTNEENRFIVRSVIELGHNLGIEVVAEGVENQATQDVLASLRCDHVQGYFLSRPAGAADTTAWLQARASALSPTAES